MNLRNRIVIAVASISAMATILTLSSMMYGNAQLIERSLENQSAAVQDRLSAAIEAETQRAVALSALVASQPKVQRAVAEDDRAALEQIFVPGFAAMKKEQGVRQFQFHKPPATSLLRVHKPEKFGDDLSGFRHTVVSANREQRVVGAVERGRAGVGLRGVSPVFFQEAHVGTVEIGLSLNSTFFEKFVGESGVELEYYFIKDQAISTFDDATASAAAERAFATIEQDNLLTAEEVLGHSAAALTETQHDLASGSYASFVYPVRDFSENTVGLVHILLPTAAIKATSQFYTLLGLGVGLVCLLLAAAAAFLFGRSLSTAIGALTERMRKLIDGDTAIDVPFQERRDELGEIARALIIFRSNTENVGRLSQEKEAAETAAAEERAAMMASLEQAFGEVAKSATDGDFSARVPDTFDDPSLARLAELMNSFVASTGDAVAAARSVLEQVADGDLRGRMDGAFAGDWAVLQNALNGSIENMSGLVREIQAAATAVDRATDRLRENATQLARRAESQSTSVEQTASSMGEINTTTSSNAETAHNAREMSQMAAKHAAGGGAIIEETIQAMSRIEDGSTKISEIISVIDGIAFQTNLLALNAAVEAARAGDAGKGFAVVASEVRTLAQRAADAARDISSLISESVSQISDGAALTNKTGEALRNLVSSVNGVAKAVDNIAAASAEQSKRVTEATAAVTELDRTTQENSAIAEQNSSTSQSLAQEAARLSKLVSRFQADAASDTPKAAAVA